MSSILSSKRFVVVGVSVAIAVAGAIFFVRANQQPSTMMRIGRVQDFPPGSVTAFELKATFDDPLVGKHTPIPIFLVNDPDTGLLALYNRDPHRGCRVTWVAAQQRFLNPCHGEKYTLTGEYLEGPAPRGLDRFALAIDDDSNVVVDVSTYQIGPPRQ